MIWCGVCMYYMLIVDVMSQKCMLSMMSLVCMYPVLNLVDGDI